MVIIGAGYVRQNGQETAWAIIGLDNFVTIYIIRI